MTPPAVRTLCLCLNFWPLFLSVSLFYPSFVTMSSSAPGGVRRVNRWTQNAEQRRESFNLEALAFSRHNINVVFAEEKRLTKALENAGIDPRTMRIGKWYQESTREDDDLHSPASNRVSDLAGADRMSYQVREPIEKDEDRLAMKRGDMPPPMPQRVANPRIPEDQALQEFHSKSDKMHRATSNDDFTKSMVWLCPICLLTIWEKHRYKCWTFIPKTREPEQAYCPKWKVQYHRCATSHRILRKQPRACGSDCRNGQLIDRRERIAWGVRLGGMPFKKRLLSTSPCKELIPHDRLDSCGNQMKKKIRAHMERSLRWSLAKKAEGSFTDSREWTACTLCSDLESVALIVEGSDLKDSFVPTANCIRDTKGRQLVTRSGLRRRRCCVCHLHHKRAMTAPGSVRKFFKTELEQVYNLEVDDSAGDANAAAHKFFKKQEYQDPHNSSVAVMFREMQREVNKGRSLECRLLKKFR